MIQPLDNEVTMQEDAIEKYFCQKFDTLKHNPMNDEVSECFFQSAMIEISMKKEPEKIELLNKSFNDIFPYQVLSKRLEVIFNYEMSTPAKIFIVQLTNGNLGSIVMYLTYLQYKTKKSGVKLIDMDAIGDIFPFGFPSTKDIQDIWDAQKVKRGNTMGSDNLLDYSTALKSIL